MKKKIALLLTVLMLCSVSAFAGQEIISLNTITIADLEKIIEDAQSISDALDAELAEVRAFDAGYNVAVENYYEASLEMSKKLLTAVLTVSELTKNDELRLQILETKMYNSLVDSINNAYASSMSYIQLLWGDEANAECDTYSGLIGAMALGYNRFINQAGEKSQEFRDALTSAFKDDTLTVKKYVELTALLDEYNEIMAQLEERSSS